jgi:hypothetical protein
MPRVRPLNLPPLSWGRVLEQWLDGVGEVVALGVEGPQLLLDSERVAGSGEVGLYVAWERNQV